MNRTAKPKKREKKKSVESSSQDKWMTDNKSKPTKNTTNTGTDDSSHR